MSDLYGTGGTTPSAGIQVPDGIFIPGDVPYRRDVGAVFLGQLNRAKTTPDDFARAHGLHPADVASVIAQKNVPFPNLLTAIEKTSPLSVRELIDPRYAHRVPVHDDSVDGVVVCHADESASKTRVYHRGKGVKYYTYFHTAVQRLSSIVPEKIVEHYGHDPADPNLPDEYFNNGHRERQMTVAIGHVNYHWIGPDGKKHVVAAKTGDANAISPFTRHSFSVPPGEEGYILAVTDLGAIGTDTFRALAHALDKDAYLALLKGAMPVDPFSSFDELGGFMFRRYDGMATTLRGPYDQLMLMDDLTFHPTFRASELRMPRDSSSHLWAQHDFLLESGRHRWGYNHGSQSVRLEWGRVSSYLDHHATLEPGASFSIQKHVPHAFRNEDGLEGKVLIMESNPIVENPFEQLALVHKFAGDKGLLRAASESELWFREAEKA